MCCCEVAKVARVWNVVELVREVGRTVLLSTFACGVENFILLALSCWYLESFDFEFERIGKMVPLFTASKND